MNPAVILARVFSVEQEAGHSLKAQLSNLQEYAKRRDLEVIRVFRIIESSTKGQRPEFERMIEFISRQKQRTALIIDCVDRLQRSFTHTPVRNALMDKDALEIHFVREGNVIDKNANSMQKLMWNMGTVMAQSYTDQLTDNVRRSIKHKLEKGEWIAMAPLGYLNTTDSATGRSLVVIDPQRAPLVERLFLEYAVGTYSMTELRKKTEEWGLFSRKNTPLGLQTVANILSNPFYCGLMRIKNKHYPHTYPQLVEHAVFRACEKRKRNPQQAVKITRHPFVLMSLITCAASGRKVTCSLQKKRYVYLMSRDPANKEKIIWVKEESVLQQLRDVLGSFALPENLLVDIIDYIKQTHEVEKEAHHAHAQEIQTEYNGLTQKLNRLTDLLIEGHIQQDVFDSKNREISLRKTELSCILNDGTKADEKFKDALCKIITLLSKSANYFESSKIDEKRGLLGFVFSNLQLEGSTLRYALRKPFEVLRDLPRTPDWRARWDESTNWELFLPISPERAKSGIRRLKELIP